MQSKKPRSSNIELLRIYSMFFIIWCHLWDGKVALSGGTFLEHLIASAAGVGAVDIFVLITDISSSIAQSLHWSGSLRYC